MTKTNYDQKQRELVISEMECLFKDLQKQVKYLKEVNKNIKKINKDYDKLEKYYLSDWIMDYDNYNGEKAYSILLQDPISNILSGIHLEKIKLLKLIAEKLV